MKISDVEIFDIQIERPRAKWTPIIVRINTDEGISGVGEMALAYGVGNDAGIGMIRNLSQSFLIGADPFKIEHLWNTMYRKTFWGQGGGPVVFGGMSAIDEALWDIKGKTLDVPVYELLGGKCRDSIRLYANGWYSDCVTPEDYARAALKPVSDGYTALKFDPFAIRPDGVWDYPERFLEKDRADIAYERVKSVREAVGPEIDILIEVHGNLGTTSAIQMGKRFEEFKPFFYEEPVDALNVSCMKKVSENVDIPIAAGERLYTRYGFRKYIEEQILDIIQPDIGLAGGITETKKISAHAETYNVHVQPHNCASPVATAAAVQLDACITNFVIQEWFPYWPDENYNIVMKDLEHQAKNGYMQISSESGLGIELNDKILTKYKCIRIE